MCDNENGSPDADKALDDEQKKEGLEGETEKVDLPIPHESDIKEGPVSVGNGSLKSGGNDYYKKIKAGAIRLWRWGSKKIKAGAVRLWRWGSALIPLSSLIVSIFAIAIPLQDSINYRKMEQASKVSVEFSRDSPNVLFSGWRGVILNSSDASIFNVDVSVASDNGFIAGFPSNVSLLGLSSKLYEYQVLPDEKVPFGKIEDLEIEGRVARLYIWVSFQDSLGEWWYKSYAISDGKDSALAYCIIDELQTSKPEHWHDVGSAKNRVAANC